MQNGEAEMVENSSGSGSNNQSLLRLRGALVYTLIRFQFCAPLNQPHETQYVPVVSIPISHIPSPSLIRVVMLYSRWYV